MLAVLPLPFIVNVCRICIPFLWSVPQTLSEYTDCVFLSTSLYTKTFSISLAVVPANVDNVRSSVIEINQGGQAQNPQQGSELQPIGGLTLHRWWRLQLLVLKDQVFQSKGVSRIF